MCGSKPPSRNLKRKFVLFSPSDIIVVRNGVLNFDKLDHRQEVNIEDATGCRRRIDQFPAVVVLQGEESPPGALGPDEENPVD